MSESTDQPKATNIRGLCMTNAHRTTTNCGRWSLITISMAMGCVLCAIGVGGCQKVLFPENEPRNQFERSDNLRDRFTPITESDVFGNPKPALRARLTPPTG
ncbi:MAG: hypothetical protein EXS12_03695 [Phycisphaerales bacterium]|nr:hypothetical protein [Phycisphaerales bacterium]